VIHQADDEIYAFLCMVLKKRQERTTDGSRRKEASMQVIPDAEDRFDLPHVLETAYVLETPFSAQLPLRQTESTLS
jgi:hypothetical protein